MAKQVTLTIDDRTISVPEGTLVVDAAKQAGIDIPVFCYHPKLKPAGMCRVCLVEIGKPEVVLASGEAQRDADGNPKIIYGAKLETACTTPVSQDMVVRTNSEKVRQARLEVLEFLLTSHPLDCPVCDKGGECPLQNLTLAYGPAESRFAYDEKMHLAKKLPLGELIYLDRERCIQCGRCVRFMDELVGEAVIAFQKRGRSMEIVSFSEPGFDSIFSGNTTDICPVGALTTADFRFGARPWEMKAVPSICNHCAVGCNIIFNLRREARSAGRTVIKRVMPRQNEMVNELWMCDKGRFGYHYLESPERLMQPHIRKDGLLQGATWDEALQLTADKIRSAGDDFLLVVGGRLSNEDLFNLKRLVVSQGGSPVLYSSMAAGDVMAQVGISRGSNIGEMGIGSALVVIASDLHEEAPIWFLRLKQAAERGAALIVINPRPTSLERYAHHVIRYEYGREINTLSALLPLASGGASLEFQAAAAALQQAKNAVIFLGSEGMGTAGSAAVARSCAELLIKTGHIGKVNNGLVAVWHGANLQGAWDMGFRPLAELEKHMAAAKVVYLAGVDCAADDPALAQVIQKAAFVIVQDLFMTESAKWADVVLPAVAYSEREGTYTSGERRVQRFYPLTPPHAGPRADFAIAAQIGRLLGVQMEGKSAQAVFECIAGSLPDYEGVTYAALAESMQQFPPLGRHDLHYGGTVYENHAGVGVQLAPAAQLGRHINLTEAPAPPKMDVPDGYLLAVAAAHVYSGHTLRHSSLLEKRMPRRWMRIHPQTAQPHDIQTGEHVDVIINGFTCRLEVVLDEGIPPGIALLPRHAGLPLREPALLKIEGKAA